MANSYFDSTLGRFRFIAIAEGISYVVLLFIAMPLKYLAGFPLAVKYTGWAHGVLFVLFMVSLASVWRAYKWPLMKVVKAFIASLLPFGTFILEKNLRKEAK